MKKSLMFVGLSGLLASCGGLSSGGDLYVNPGSVTLDSEYFVSNLAFRGGTYSGAVICDDRTTLLNFGFTYGGDLNSVTVRLRGSGGGTTGIVAPRIERKTSSSLLVSFLAPSATVPLSTGDRIGARSIVVNPRPVFDPVVIGATRVELVANSPFGSTSQLNSNFVPVVDNCP